MVFLWFSQNQGIASGISTKEKVIPTVLDLTAQGEASSETVVRPVVGFFHGEFKEDLMGFTGNIGFYGFLWDFMGFYGGFMVISW